MLPMSSEREMASKAAVVMAMLDRNPVVGA
jgi:hypothetical protein